MCAEAFLMYVLCLGYKRVDAVYSDISSKDLTIKTNIDSELGSRIHFMQTQNI